MGVVESRYARALYAETPSGSAGQAAGALQILSEYFNENENLIKFLLNPAIPANVQGETVLRLLPDGVPDFVKKFCLLLAKRQRLEILPGVAGAYASLLNETGDLLDIEISSAYELEEAQYEHIGKTYSSRFNARAFTVRRTVEPSLLGGVRVKVGDWVSDGTLKMRMDKLKEILKGSSI